MLCPIPNSTGSVKPVGPRNAPVLLVGEAAGVVEAVKGEPFTGPAGWMLDRVLRLAGLDRGQFRIGNTVLCHPPGDFLVNAPWEHLAFAHCRPQLLELLAEPHRVIVPLGGSALRQVMGFQKGRQANSEGGIRVQDFHGAPITGGILGDKWVVPSFHPSFLQRGETRFIGTMVFDLLRAMECASGEYKENKPKLIINPDYARFRRWANDYLAQCRGEAPPWLAYDVETADKVRSTDEGALGKQDRSYQINRINLSYATDEGWTVPWVSPFIEVVREMLQSTGPKVVWNGPYDNPRLLAAECPIAQPIFDMMDAWHVFRSALPRGLGFVAPFCSNTPPYKYLGSANLEYCAMDGVIELRCAYQIAEWLQKDRMWDVFLRHCWQLDVYVLRPAEKAGLHIDREALEDFTEDLRVQLVQIDRDLGEMVPEEAMRLLPLAGLSKPGKGSKILIEKEVVRSVQVCRTCGALEVGKKHVCKDPDNPKKKSKTLVPELVMEDRLVTRWFRREKFKALSPKQILRIIREKGHKPGKHRKSKADTTEAKALRKLAKQTQDPFYATLLNRREVAKMYGTYGKGIIEKLDADNLLHTTFTHIPSTLRLSSRDPNLTNIASHVGQAAKFRKCVIP